jgi:WD40 repeat protein
MVHRLKLHKVLIQSLSFSQDEKYLASLGGQDDNTLVIWDVSLYSYSRFTVREASLFREEFLMILFNLSGA